LVETDISKRKEKKHEIESETLTMDVTRVA
jgi:hypothetical protein